MWAFYLVLNYYRGQPTQNTYVKFYDLYFALIESGIYKQERIKEL